MNHYLRPLVNNLIKASDGFKVGPTPLYPMGRVMRLRIMIIACDLVAARKLIAMVAHNGLKGCSRCKATFPTVYYNDDGFIVEVKDAADDEDDPSRGRVYSVHVGEPRTIEEHREQAQTAREKPNMKQLMEYRRATGVGWSELLRLEYLDIIRAVIFDPMHNLLSGTFQTLLRYWRVDADPVILDGKTLSTILKKLASCDIPGDIGRSFRRINHKLSHLKSHDLYVLCVILGPEVFRDHLPAADMEILLMLREMCIIVCGRYITQQGRKRLQTLSTNFIDTFNEVYGNLNSFPNLHFHLHLAEDMRYGPGRTRWCFPLERLNGIISNFNSSGKDVEKSYMRSYLRLQLSLGTIQHHLTPEQSNLLQLIMNDQKRNERLLLHSSDEYDTSSVWTAYNQRMHAVGNEWCPYTIITKESDISLNTADYKFINSGVIYCYQQHLPEVKVIHVQHMLSTRSTKMIWFGEELTSAHHSSTASSYVCIDYVEADQDDATVVHSHPAQIFFFL